MGKINIPKGEKVDSLDFLSPQQQEDYFKANAYSGMNGVSIFQAYTACGLEIPEQIKYGVFNKENEVTISPHGTMFTHDHRDFEKIVTSVVSSITGEPFEKVYGEWQEHIGEKEERGE